MGISPTLSSSLGFLFLKKLLKGIKEYIRRILYLYYKNHIKNVKKENYMQRIKKTIAIDLNFYWKNKMQSETILCLHRFIYPIELKINWKLNVIQIGMSGMYKEKDVFFA